MNHINCGQVHTDHAVNIQAAIMKAEQALKLSEENKKDIDKIKISIVKFSFIGSTAAFGGSKFVEYIVIPHGKTISIFVQNGCKLALNLLFPDIFAGI